MGIEPGRFGGCIRILRWVFLVVLGMEAGSALTARADAEGLTADRLLRMSGPELNAVYAQGMAVGIPPGRVRGTALLAPGTRRNRLLATGTRLVWQGKVFEPAGDMAVNRFFGLRMIRAQVYQDQSWLDGAPALILDYSRTSRLYASYRDEIRQIAPGLFLGLMYSRTEPNPTLKMYFVLEVCP